MADARHNKQALEKLLKAQPPADKKKAGDDKDQNSQQQADNKNGDSKDKNGQQTPDNKKGGDRQDKNSQQQADAGQGGDGQDNSGKQKTDRNKTGDSKEQSSEQQAEAKAPSTQQAGAEQPSGQPREAGQAHQDQNGSKDRSLDTAAYEQQQADERWLRRIPDDPGGLLRRKFLYQYSQRVRQQNTAEQAW